MTERENAVRWARREGAQRSDETRFSRFEFAQDRGARGTLKTRDPAQSRTQERTRASVPARQDARDDFPETVVAHTPHLRDRYGATRRPRDLPGAAGHRDWRTRVGQGCRAQPLAL